MTPPATNFRVKSLTPALIRQVFLWGPIIGGIVHQFVMYFGPKLSGDKVVQTEPFTGSKFDCMPVFLDPPGYIKPLVTLGYQWWYVLLLISVVVCVLAYLEQIRTLPNRLVLPFYLYIVFLLIFVKPVSHGKPELPAKCGPEAEATPTAVIIWDSPVPS